MNLTPIRLARTHSSGLPAEHRLRRLLALVVIALPLNLAGSGAASADPIHDADPDPALAPQSLARLPDDESGGDRSSMLLLSLLLDGGGATPDAERMNNHQRQLHQGVDVSLARRLDLFGCGPGADHHAPGNASHIIKYAEHAGNQYKC